MPTLSTTKMSARQFLLMGEDPPGVRQGAAGQMYLAYLRDPDGHKVVAVYRMPAA